MVDPNVYVMHYRGLLWLSARRFLESIIGWIVNDNGRVELLTNTLFCSLGMKVECKSMLVGEEYKMLTKEIFGQNVN